MKIDLHNTCTGMLVLTGLLLLGGCKKKTESPDSGGLYYCMLAEVIADDAIQHFINKSGVWDTLGFLGNCASREVSGNGNQVSYTYAGNGLACQDGNKRIGSLSGIYDGGDSIRIGFEGYSVYQKSPLNYTGTILLINDPAVGNTFQVLLFWEANGLYAGDHRAKGNLAYKRSITFGASAETASDDATLQSGSGYWILSNETNYTETIYTVTWLNPQTRRNVDGCRQFVSGQAAVSHDDYVPLIFDWGGGTCDRTFTITKGNTIQTNTLP